MQSDFGVCSKDGVVPDAAMATRMAEGGYDVVIANILMPPLLLLVQTLSGAVRPGGKICLSGARCLLALLLSRLSPTRFHNVRALVSHNAHLGRYLFID